MQGKTSPRDRDALRRQRALYYALKSSDDAFFSFIPRQQLFYALNKSYQPGAKRPRRPTRYDCQTQHTGTLEWRLLASADAPLNLWESGTVLKWIARSAVPGGSAQASGRALRAAVNMWHAAEYWNSIMDGRVTFRYAEDITSANININIILQPGPITRGFFPNNNAVINALSYGPVAGYWDFVHELAHVVGLPHENTHAVHPEWSRNLYTNTNTSNAHSAKNNSIWLGTCDTHSVAGYHAANSASENDTLVIRNAYDSLQDGQVLSATIGSGKVATHLSTVVRRISPLSDD